MRRLTIGTYSHLLRAAVFVTILSVAVLPLEAQDGYSKLLIFPFLSDEDSGFAPLVAEKVLRRRFDDTNTIRVETVKREELDIPEGVSRDSFEREEIVGFLDEVAEERGAEYALAGELKKEKKLYHLDLLLVNTEKDSVVLDSKKTAVGLSDLDRIAREFSEEVLAKEFGEETAEKVAQKREAESEDARSKTGEDIASLEMLAKEDPDKAIEKLPKEVQEEVKKRAKNEAKEEVQQEEIQKLYEREKEEERVRRRRKWQKTAMVSSYVGKFSADILSEISVHARMNSLGAWGLYMNNYQGPSSYDQYDKFHEQANGLTITKYSILLAASGTLGYTYYGLPGDALSIRKGTRGLFAVSSVFYGLGRMTSLAGGGLGYSAMDKYAEYLRKDESIAAGDAYKEYRSFHDWYEWGRYTTYGLQFLGATGIAISYLWPGEQVLLAEEKAAKRRMGTATILSGTAAVTAQMALTMWARGVESSISAHSPSGDPESDLFSTYKKYAYALGGSAALLQTLATINAVRAIYTEKESTEESTETEERESGTSGESSAGEGDTNSESEVEKNRPKEKSFLSEAPFGISFLPGPEGFTIAFERRWR